MAELPRPSDSTEERKRKETQIDLSKDSFLLHQNRCTEVLQSLTPKLKALNRKQSRVGGVTEDWASETQSGRTSHAVWSFWIKTMCDLSGSSNKSIITEPIRTKYLRCLRARTTIPLSLRPINL